jgi:hypothetical protein
MDSKIDILIKAGNIVNEGKKTNNSSLIKEGCEMIKDLDEATKKYFMEINELKEDDFVIIENTVKIIDTIWREVPNLDSASQNCIKKQTDIAINDYIEIQRKQLHKEVEDIIEFLEQYYKIIPEERYKQLIKLIKFESKLPKLFQILYNKYQFDEILYYCSAELITKFIKNYGMNINFVYKNGNTFLHVIFYDKNKSIKCIDDWFPFIINGINVNIKNKENQSVVDIVQHKIYENTEIKRIIEACAARDK